MQQQPGKGAYKADEPKNDGDPSDLYHKNYIPEYFSIFKPPAGCGAE